MPSKGKSVPKPKEKPAPTKIAESAYQKASVAVAQLRTLAMGFADKEELRARDVTAELDEKLENARQATMAVHALAEKFIDDVCDLVEEIVGERPRGMPMKWMRPDLGRLGPEPSSED